MTDWALATAAKPTADAPEAYLLRERMTSDSRPFRITDRIGDEYLVKPMFPRPADYVPAHRLDPNRQRPGGTDAFRDPPGQPGRYMNAVLAAEQIALRLGNFLGAPVPAAAIVMVTPEFLEGNPGLGEDLVSGPAHAGRWIVGLGPPHRAWPPADRVRCPENGARCADITLLYSLAHAHGDPQVFFSKFPPPRIFSLDHGFGLGGAHRTPGDFSNCACAVEIARHVARSFAITQEEWDSSLRKLRNMTDTVVADAVAHVPEEWGMDADERIATARWLANRRDELLTEKL